MWAISTLPTKPGHHSLVVSARSVRPNATLSAPPDRGTMAGAPHEPLGFAEITNALRYAELARDDRFELPLQRAERPQQLPMAPPWCIGREP